MSLIGTERTNRAGLTMSGFGVDQQKWLAGDKKDGFAPRRDIGCSGQRRAHAYSGTPETGTTTVKVAEGLCCDSSKRCRQRNPARGPLGRLDPAATGQLI